MMIGVQIARRRVRNSTESELFDPSQDLLTPTINKTKEANQMVFPQGGHF